MNSIASVSDYQESGHSHTVQVPSSRLRPDGLLFFRVLREQDLDERR